MMFFHPQSDRTDLLHTHRMVSSYVTRSGRRKVPAWMLELEQQLISALGAREAQSPLPTASDAAMLLDMNETANHLGLSVSRVKQLVAADELPSVKIGRRRFVRREQLERYVEGLGNGPDEIAD